jgi:hypothetical protein
MDYWVDVSTMGGIGNTTMTCPFCQQELYIVAKKQSYWDQTRKVTLLVCVGMFLLSIPLIIRCIKANTVLYFLAHMLGVAGLIGLIATLFGKNDEVSPSEVSLSSGSPVVTAYHNIVKVRESRGGSS